MLKKRILTAVILIPIVVSLVYFLPPQLFLLLTLLIAVLAAWEWSRLMGVENNWGRFFYTLLVGMTYYLVYVFIIATGVYKNLYIPIVLVQSIAFVWWLVGLMLILIYPRGSNIWGKSTILRGLMGLLVLVPCWVAITFIRTVDITLLFYLFILIWGADTSAYFVGRKWGKNKLAPLVSPGKTWEGCIGAIFFSIVAALIALNFSNISLTAWPWFIALSVITVIFSIIGDLLESILKRQAGVKDSGQILPGHGGLLDRIDSLTAAAPVFLLAAMLLNLYLVQHCQGQLCHS